MGCEYSDLEVAVKAVGWASFLNAGQVCTSAERVYVQKDIYKPFLERLKAFTENLEVGDGMKASTDIGPMIGASYREKVESHVKDAVKRGAKLLAGGRKLEGPGFFFQPTVLADVDHSMTVMRRLVGLPRDAIQEL